MTNPMHSEENPMVTRIGIRREDKNVWERRTPVIPEHVAALTARHPVEFVVQPSDIRVFSDEEYRKAGAVVSEDLSMCSIIFAVKEIPETLFEPGKTYIFFSHTIKGQAANMPALKKLVALGCNLIDYELVVDDDGKRMIFFGRHAGLAGMIDTLWALGRRLDHEGIASPFPSIEPAHQYDRLDDAMVAIEEVGNSVSTGGLPEALTPMVCGFSGYGNVSQGAQEIFDLLPFEEIDPGDLGATRETACKADDRLFKVVFKEEDIVEPVDGSTHFDLQDYYHHPEKYRSVFDKYVPHLTLLANCIYWEPKYPRLVTEANLKKIWEATTPPRLKVIGDISCDIEGSIECTMKSTDSGNPIYVYEPRRDAIVDGFAGEGPVILAVDNLPCEIPYESSTEFSSVLADFIPAIASADLGEELDKSGLPDPIKRAFIVHRGEIRPSCRHLEPLIR